MVIRESEVLDYHDGGRPGKLEVIASKPCLTQRDLSLAYTPGVAIPCLRIEKDPDEAFRYTGRGNLVAVISNGTAVLGLGNIGALAGKPVMEGKGVLFKRFADVNVFDIEVATEDADELIRCVKLLEPTFGGINLEDIKAPECFHIEETLQAQMDIPIFHDDQHGTAIISSAALLNALELTGKDISKIKVVFAGAGAAGIACANMYIALGVDPANVLMVDSKGVLYEGRADAMNKYKQAYVRRTECRTIGDALVGADVFVGVSSKDLVSQDMVRSMADNPIVFAMANPDPEITYPDAKAARPDVIMATGRSDYPNQVNNVLGFPFIFRGALDVRARAINMEMKLAAAHALAALAKEEVPDAVINAYGGERFSFGPDYIIPKPFDFRVLTWEAVAVARAAVETGVARQPITDWEAYAESLERRILGKAREVTRSLQNKARRVGLKRIVLPESGEEKILRAALTLADEHIARPVLVGDPEHIHNRADALGIDLHDTVEILDPAARMETYANELYRLRERRGVTPHTARLMLQDPAYLGVMMVHMGDADGLVCGLNRSYPETIRPALQILKLRPGVTKVAGMYCVIVRDRVLFFADATVNIEPTADELAEIAVNAADIAQRYFDVEPRVAMLSFSNFGSVNHAFAHRMADATRLARKRAPGLVVEGEMAPDTALIPEIVERNFPHSLIRGDANVLIFPNVQSGNISLKLVQRLAGGDVIGPILMGLNKPVNALNYYSSVQEIVNIATITAIMAGGNGVHVTPPAVDSAMVHPEPVLG
ncbi:MAG TPA: NADP-dependent malic enzyme [Longimicrobiales bacterium]|nr:NADP-dependent malic enzyme [Longimicrobiales bacterium]